jgi:hypothetical protein
MGWEREAGEARLANLQPERQARKPCQLAAIHEQAVFQDLLGPCLSPSTITIGG